jgi:hypothetical protein
MSSSLRRAVGSDSENEDEEVEEEEEDEEEEEEQDETGEVAASMRNGDDVDPVLRIEGQEEDGSDDDDEDDEDVPVPLHVNGASGFGASAPTTKQQALPHKATMQRKLPFVAPKTIKGPAPALKPNVVSKSATPAAPAPAPTPAQAPVSAPAPAPAPAPLAEPAPTTVAAAGSEGDEEEGEEQTPVATMGQRQLPRFSSYDVAADAEAQRKRQTEATSVMSEAPIEPQVDEGVAQEDLIFRDIKYQKYAVVRASQRLHQRFDGMNELYKPFGMSQSNYSKNKYAKKGGWIDLLLNEQATKVLATVAIIETKWEGEANGHISLVAALRIELLKDDASAEKQFNDFVRKMPQVPTAGLYVQLEERHVARLYDISDCGLPTQYHPKHAHVHYRTVPRLQEHALIDNNWVLWAPPPKPRAPGGRKSPAKESERTDASKKQKTMHHQTILSSVAVPTHAATSSENTNTALVEVEEEEQPVVTSATNGFRDQSHECEPPQPVNPHYDQPPQSNALVSASTSTLTVPQLVCKIPVVDWRDNAGGTLTANLPNAYTYALHRGPNGTLLIANLNT